MKQNRNIQFKNLNTLVLLLEAWRSYSNGYNFGRETPFTTKSTGETIDEAFYKV